MYIEEAHAADEWPIALPHEIPQPQTMEQRLDAVRAFISLSKWTLPLYVDTMNNSFSQLFAAWPTRFFLFNGTKIAYISKPDNAHFSLQPLVNALDTLLI